MCQTGWIPIRDKGSHPWVTGHVKIVLPYFRHAGCGIENIGVNQKDRSICLDTLIGVNDPVVQVQ